MNTTRCGLLKDRQRLRETLHSHKFQMVIIGMVGLDFLIVLVMLLIDIEVIRGGINIKSLQLDFSISSISLLQAINLIYCGNLFFNPFAFCSSSSSFVDRNSSFHKHRDLGLVCD